MFTAGRCSTNMVVSGAEVRKKGVQSYTVGHEDRWLPWQQRLS